MQNYREIGKNLFYVGCSTRNLSLFENVYPVENGMSYNSYFLNDDKTVLFDTVDKSCRCEFFENVKALLNGRNLDYLIINHLEPDHSALIKAIIEKFPKVKLVCNQKTKAMLYQFFEFDFDIENNFYVIKEGDILNTGHHEFTFVMAPMVHWPEAMVTYDITEKVLFSADAFGSFGALNGNLFDNETTLNLDEYRRYYTNIVGKYGIQVNNLLNKAKTLELHMVCPLHGLILKENIKTIYNKYLMWANYEPEIKSTLIVYGSIYGGTKNAAEILACNLADLGIKNIKMYDVSQTHFSYILSDAFKYSNIVIASATYNNGIFVNMEKFLQDLIAHNLSKRTFAIIENGSWMCRAGDIIKQKLSALNNCNFIENKVTVKSTLKTEQEKELKILANDIYDSLNH